MVKRTEGLLSQPNHQRVGEVINSSSSIKPIVLSRKTSLPIGYSTIRREGEDISNQAEGEESEDEKAGDSLRHSKPVARSRTETLEEKKLRKQQAKDEQRMRRQMKREVKSIYKSEFSKQVQSYAKQQDIQQAHVFKTAG